MIRIAARLMLSTGLILMVNCAGTSDEGKRFSQMSGFAEYFSHVPDGVPSSAEQVLLEQYRPRHYLGRHQTRPIDFYADYIANGRLHYCNGETIATEVNSKLLNAHRDDPQVCFDYNPPPQFDRQDGYRYPLYARIDYAQMRGKRLTFLSYHLVFASSGILKGLSWYKAAALRVVASLTDWHQLDNYIMVSVVLNSNSQPIAMLLQQHNYTTTYVPGVHLPRHDWWAVDIAERSNELYPHSPQPARYRAVSFLEPRSLAYILESGSPTLLSGYDHTRGEALLPTRLTFLPREDAFYRFVGRLGDRRLLPGRTAPPGAEFNTLPAFKPLPISLVASYRRSPPDAQYQQIFADFYRGMQTRLTTRTLQRLTDRFVEDIEAQGMSL